MPAVHVRDRRRVDDESSRGRSCGQRGRHARDRGQRRRASRSLRDAGRHERDLLGLERVFRRSGRPRTVRYPAGHLRRPPSLVEAIAANLPGAVWQRCRTHYAANLMSITQELVAGGQGHAPLRL